MRQSFGPDRRWVLARGAAGAAWLVLGRPVLGLLGAAQSAPDADRLLFDADGFRRTRYRAPVDRDPAPAKALPLDRAMAMRPGRDALFLDVLPAEGARRDPVTGQWLGPPAHATIPGARWYPEVGRAPVDPALWDGLVAAVGEARGRHPGWSIVVFCRADCWMSWNAARRLARGGIADVFWLAEGIDGWHDRRRPLVPAMPAIIPPLPPNRGAIRPKV